MLAKPSGHSASHESLNFATALSRECFHALLWILVMRLPRCGNTHAGCTPRCPSMTEAETLLSTTNGPSLLYFLAFTDHEHADADAEARQHLFPSMTKLGADDESRLAVPRHGVANRPKRTWPARRRAGPTGPLPVAALGISMAVTMHVVDAGLVAVVLDDLQLRNWSPVRATSLRVVARTRPAAATTAAYKGRSLLPHRPRTRCDPCPHW